MYTIVLAIIYGAAFGCGLGFGRAAAPGWSIFWGLAAALAAQAVMGLWLKAKIETGMADVQGILVLGQKKLQQKVNQWQLRPPGSMQQAQLEIEREQRLFLTQALEATTALDKWQRWSLLLNKQLATLRMQLYYQLKDFKKVDELLPKCLFMEPLTVAMKMARMYKIKAEGIDSFFEKHATRQYRLSSGDVAIIYATYSWILVQQGDIDKAHKVLIQGCEKSDKETLKRNRDLLANNKTSHFNNAGFGDEWYALGLETPKVKGKRQRFAGTRPF